MNALEYLVKKHDYIVSHGYDNKNSGLIANELAFLLLVEGLSPRIELVYQIIYHCDTKAKIKTMVPLIFGGKMEPWSEHIVCCVKNTVYDPLNDGPLSTADYTRVTFGQDIALRVKHDKNRVLKELSKQGYKLEETLKFQQRVPLL
jgi:hypothetical protein